MSGLPTPDRQFDQLEFRLSEILHHYGSRVHLLSDPLLLSHLARLCAETTVQPTINELVSMIYSGLLNVVVNQEFPRRRVQVRTRMIAQHPEAVFQGNLLDPETPVVTVNLARAGTVPSHVTYTHLNYFMNPVKVRQDHISIARQSNDQHQVTGSAISGHKIGGATEGAIVLFPDPMGATGSTIMEAIDLYKAQEKATGKKTLKFVAVHCIVTPEYLRAVLSKHPDLVVYAVRLDRGLSSSEVLKTVPGEKWEQERGLNSLGYIVPGGGGFGEVLNNAYV